MEQSVRILSILCFAIIGLSHLLQPQVWISFFKSLIAKQAAGSFINGFITLPMGVLIVSFHEVWTGLPMLLTIMGWCHILKATVCFCFPGIGLKSMKRVERNNTGEFRIGGVIFIVIAVILATTV